MEKLNIKIKKLKKEARIPTAGSDFAAGMDMYLCADTDSVAVEPGESVMLGTGLAMAIPAGCFGGIFARSGLACKQGLRPANCVGVVDADYRGEVKVCITNDSKNRAVLKNGDRIAQMIVLPYPPVVFEEADELPDTERGDGGFGHTGA